jgi:hypothetical protein
MRASRRAATFLLLAASYRFCGKRGARQGVSGAQRGLRHEGGAVQESEEGRDKREGESCWKSGGGTSASLYLGQGRGWQMDAAGGEGGHGAARPDRVIHRYIFNTMPSQYFVGS